MKSKGDDVHEKALSEALEMLKQERSSGELGLRSALKQAGADAGIPYGPEMGVFVEWAEARLLRPRGTRGSRSHRRV
jgi:hypothetical protein